MKQKFLWGLLLVLASCMFLNAQELPKDPELIQGKLDNGLTYYVRKNTMKENRANFYIVQKVGSMQEEESQRGLAHFLEHMAFNGTKNFPNNEEGKGIIDYLETIGVKFGANLNAYTSMDETVYNINDVPTNVKGAVDSALLILSDWSDALLLREKDIDKERKVIHEEWRTRNDVSSRLIDSISPVIFNESKYAYRMPIGLMSVVDNFKPQELIDYYHKWYRPDLQAIIVVGDIDPQYVENKIVELFSDNVLPENPAERVYETIPRSEEPSVAIVTDKEMPSTNVMLMIKRVPLPKEVKQSPAYFFIKYSLNVMTSVMNQRFSAVLHEADAPAVAAGVSDGAFFGVRALDAVNVFSVPKANRTKESIEMMLYQVERVKRYGFTESEVEEASKNILKAYEKMYNEREKQPNSVFIQQYVSNFLTDEPILTFEGQYQMMKSIAAMAQASQVNQIVQQVLSTGDIALVIMGSDAEEATYPSVEEIKGMIAATPEMEVAPNEEDKDLAPLLSELPEKGSIVKETKDGDATTWVLSNGAKVIFQPTDFKEDEIIISGSADGGLTEVKLTPADYKVFSSVVAVGGLGVHNVIDLPKVLAGKNVKSSLDVNDYNRTISAFSGKDDLETLMQLIYLSFTDVRKDTEAFTNFVNRYESLLSQISRNPNATFADSIAKAQYIDPEMHTIPTVEEIHQVNYDNILNIYNDQVANAGEFTFYIVGNTTADALKPLVEQYIASLPGKPTPKRTTFTEFAERKGNFTNNFTKELETHKATTAIIYRAALDYTIENSVKMSVMNQLFNMEFVEKIREKEGGTYGVGVNYGFSRIPTSEGTLSFSFDCEPERREHLVNKMYEVVDEMRKDGPDAAMLDKVIKFMKKQYETGKKENSVLIGKLTWKELMGVDYDAEFTKAIDNITVDSMRDFVDKFMAQGNRIEVSMSSDK